MEIQPPSKKGKTGIVGIPPSPMEYPTLFAARDFPKPTVSPQRNLEVREVQGRFQQAVVPKDEDIILMSSF